MKKRGFTLVELLAVIAILAILVIMALPAVLRMYRQSRINNFQNEVRGVYKAAQQQFLSDSMLLESGQKILYTNATSCTPTGVDTVKELDMTGNSNFKYYVLVNVDGKVLNVRASNGTYSYSLAAEDKNHDIKIENIEVEDNNGETLDSDITSSLCLSSESNYVPHIATVVNPSTCNKTTPGCELTIGGENFYVVSSNSSETVLLAKYDLKEDGTSYSQDTSGTDTNIVKVMFLDSNNIAYWDGCKYSGTSNNCTSSPSGLLSPYSNDGASYCTFSIEAKCAYVYDENAVNIYPVVQSYAYKIETLSGITITGRLMVYDEAKKLDVNIRKDMNDFAYWLGSAYGRDNVWDVNRGGSIWPNGAVATIAIRPVIIVSTSDL